MASGFTARLIVIAGALLATAVAAQAQALQRLTVESFTLSTDADRPRVDVPFHLLVTLRVRERVTDIENLQLPMLAQVELLGDERQTVAGRSGTQYREVITVVTHNPGAIVIAPATLQARDARDGRPKQWFTNGMTLNVGGIAPQAIRNGAALVLGTILTAGQVIFWTLVFSSLVGLGILIFRRRPVARSAPVVEQPVETVVPRSRPEQIDDALVVLRAERTRSAAVAVRSAVWRLIGAPEGETLGDVLRRPGASETPLRGVLIALERSAFTYDADLQPAVDDACAALERYAGSLT